MLILFLRQNILFLIDHVVSPQHSIYVNQKVCAQSLVVIWLGILGYSS